MCSDSGLRPKWVIDYDPGPASQATVGQVDLPSSKYGSLPEPTSGHKEGQYLWCKVESFGRLADLIARL